VKFLDHMETCPTCQRGRPCATGLRLMREDAEALAARMAPIPRGGVA
jgi:hypothetical protein